jgi:uncharacterized protein (DUF4213/DUF364 family)
MILRSTIDFLNKRHRSYIEELYIQDARIGLFTSGVILSDGSAGLSSTLKPSNSEIFVKKKDRDFGDFTPNQIKGKRVKDLFASDKQDAIINTLKIAVLNAVSSRLLSDSPYTILSDADPIDQVDLSGSMIITIVGAFQSYINRIKETENKLNVLEYNPEALSEEDRKYYLPAKNFGEVLPVSDLVIITGLTLVNNSFDTLLKAIRPEAVIIVTGPSSSFIPDVLFSHNVDMIGALRVRDPELMLQTVSEAGAGYHMFRYCAEKICILNRPGQV